MEFFEEICDIKAYNIIFYRCIIRENLNNEKNYLKDKLIITFDLRKSGKKWEKVRVRKRIVAKWQIKKYKSQQFEGKSIRHRIFFRDEVKRITASLT
jgi:hypothetical protein